MESLSEILESQRKVVSDANRPSKIISAITQKISLRIAQVLNKWYDLVCERQCSCSHEVFFVFLLFFLSSLFLFLSFSMDGAVVGNVGTPNYHDEGFVRDTVGPECFKSQGFSET